MEEDIRLEELTKSIEQWWAQPRWQRIQRPYKAVDIAKLRGSINLTYASHFMSKKLYHLMKDAYTKKQFHHTFGALDPVQITNLAKYLTTVYVSGWQCSSTASVTNEPGPDFADYPANTVPTKVDQLVKALIFHERKQTEARNRMTVEERLKTPKHDFLPPIIADADTGFGGITSVMKLIKLMIEAGAGGIHMEDQRAGTKKCGHMGGKVLVACREHMSRLTAARLQADIMECDLIIVARTDALSATFIDNNVDPVDQPYIIGAIDSENPKATGTFIDAGVEVIKKSFFGAQQESKLQQWTSEAKYLGLDDARVLAKNMGFEFYFDWEKTRSSEGYYRVKGCIDFCVARCNEYSKISDALWMETPTPNLKVAKEFSDKIRKLHPGIFLTYNLSPSFNWDAAGMDDKQIAEFSTELGKLGYCWQFITLAGFHANALVTEKFAKDFKERKMIAYVEKIQRKEAKHNVDQLKHQTWSGAEMIDNQQMLVTNNEEMNSTNKHSTEHQFKNHLPKPKL